MNRSVPVLGRNKSESDKSEVRDQKPGSSKFEFWARLMLVSGAALLAMCAKKLLPPSPDRFPPHLIEVNARSRVQVELVFDEPVDVKSVPAESLVLKAGDGTTPVIRGISRGKSSERMVVWTEPQERQGYVLKGMVRDEAGNPARFAARFTGSSRVDTITPRVTGVQPSPGSTRQQRGERVAVRFSEPVDTTALVRALFAPTGCETLFQQSWGTDWQELTWYQRTGTLRLGCRDSLEPGTVVYFLLLPGVPDLEGNRTTTAAFTYFTPDSVLIARTVRGRAIWQEGPIGTGTVFFIRDYTRALTPILADGSFTVRLAPGDYLVKAVVDTNQDGRAELVSSDTTFNTEAESLDILLGPELSPKPLDAYRR